MLKLFLIIIISFFIVNISTSTFKSSSDGYDKIGFPFVFYQKLGGKCIDCIDKNFFEINYLIIDFIFTASIVSAIFLIYKTVKQK